MLNTFDFMLMSLIAYTRMSVPKNDISQTAVTATDNSKLKKFPEQIVADYKVLKEVLNNAAKNPDRITPALRVLSGESAAIPTSALKIGGGVLGGFLAGKMLSTGLTPSINPEKKEKDARAIRRKRLLIALAMAAGGGGLAAGHLYKDDIKQGLNNLYKGFALPKV
jgi:hypothetical protein